MTLQNKSPTIQIIAIIIFFMTSLLISYSLIAMITQRTYSIPEYQSGTENNSTMGGEGLLEHTIPVSLRPNPGALNISLDTAIYLHEMRTFNKNLHTNPEIKFSHIKEEPVALASRETIYYPSELLQPNTIYNVSGTMGTESVWWIFTTGSEVTPQQYYEIYISPYTLHGSIIASAIATIIFTKIIWKPTKTNKKPPGRNHEK